MQTAFGYSCNYFLLNDVILIVNRSVRFQRAALGFYAERERLTPPLTWEMVIGMPPLPMRA
jgi:hypothetical protein